MLHECPYKVFDWTIISDRKVVKTHAQKKKKKCTRHSKTNTFLAILSINQQ